MKKYYKKLCVVLIVCLLFLTGVQPVYAAESRQELSAESSVKNTSGQKKAEDQEIDLMINPLYQDVLDEAEVADEIASLQKVQQTVPYAEQTVFQTEDAAMEYVKDQMVNRINNITVSLDRTAYDSESFETIFYGAMEYSDDCSGEEGDALLWVWRGYNGKVSYKDDTVILSYTVSYYTTYEQEEKLTEAVDTAMAEMALEGKTEYNKTVTIYDYICDHVDYDYSYSQYTAYDALCTGTAVCQGYAVLFYRLCKEAGLSVRVISGLGNGGAHGWNIVRIGDYYYNVDNTWDGQDSELRHNYFLKNDEDFVYHERDKKYATVDFYERYPMSPESWIDYSNFAEPYQVENPESTFITIEDKTVSSLAEGKPKLLIFFGNTCYSSQYTIRSISNSDFSDVDIIAAEIYNTDKSGVREFKDTYGKDSITFSYSTDEKNRNIMWDYVMRTGFETRVSLPVIFYIDADNQVQYATQRECDAETVSANIAYYLTDMDFTFGMDTVELGQGDEYTAAVYVNGDRKNNSIFLWESSDEKVATVNEHGTITAVSDGSCKITCKLNKSKYGMFSVVVGSPKEVPATAVVLDQDVLTLKSGETAVLTATVTPTDHTDEIIWTSSDTSVAVVDDNGTVTAVADGAAVIKVKVGSASAECKVTVKGSEQTKPESGRVSGATRYSTAVQCAELMRNGGSFSAVVIANADNFPDALAGSTLAAAVDAPILLVGKSDTGTKETLAYIKEYVEKSGRVYLLGGNSAVPESVVTTLKGYGYQNIKRLGGETRYETNMQIVNEMTIAKGTDIVIVSGTGYADSLSISGIAGARNMPIFLAGSALTETASAKIESIAPSHIYIIGGTSAVNDEVEKQAKTLCSSVVRISGATRYDTSLEVAKYFGMNQADSVVFAYGGNFPDGLTGGALAASLNAPVILVANNNYEKQETFLNNSSIVNIYVMGGTSVISDETMKHLVK